MKEILVTATPFCTTNGRLLVPDDVDFAEDSVEEYVRKHLDKVKWEEPEISYEGDSIVDCEIEENEE